MVAPAITHRDSLTSDLLRGLIRAKVEGIVVYRKTATTLGIATVVDGVWTDRPYILTITGEGAGALVCDCKAGQAGRTCKHLAVGLLARKYGVFAKQPTVTPAINPLVDLFN